MPTISLVLTFMLIFLPSREKNALVFGRKSVSNLDISFNLGQPVQGVLLDIYSSRVYWDQLKTNHISTHIDYPWFHTIALSRSCAYAQSFVHMKVLEILLCFRVLLKSDALCLVTGTFHKKILCLVFPKKTPELLIAFEYFCG